jgi:hypothetical protein
MKYDDLYTNAKNTKPVYNIKKHIVVDSKVVYNTGKPPYETTVIFYVMAAFILLCALHNAISIVLAIYNGILDLFGADDDY